MNNCEYTLVGPKHLMQHYCVKCGHLINHDFSQKSYSRNCPKKILRCQNVGTSGFYLHKLLKSFGLTASASCRCTARMQHMNVMGNDWCEENIDTIVGWLAEEAANRGLPFLNAVGRILVRRAIANARREAERAKDPPH
jgi:hypothetical protein